MKQKFKLFDRGAVELAYCYSMYKLRRDDRFRFVFDGIVRGRFDVVRGYGKEYYIATSLMPASEKIKVAK